MTLPKSKLGDKGQRYVICGTLNGITRELAYSNNDWETVVAAFRKWPSISMLSVVDRTVENGQVVHHEKVTHG